MIETIPKQFQRCLRYLVSNHFRRLLWSTVSKAAGGWGVSRWPSFADQWPRQCHCCLNIQSAVLVTHFPITLEINQSLYIDLKFLNSPWSRDDFWSRGLSITCRNNSGVRPDSKEIWTILIIIIGKIVGRRHLSAWPGTGSSSYDWKDVELMIIIQRLRWWDSRGQN